MKIIIEFDFDDGVVREEGKTPEEVAAVFLGLAEEVNADAPPGCSVTVRTEQITAIVV